MDPIGTVRREDHEEGGGHSIWMRQNPGYPDSEMTDTEWTCVWSTAPGNLGARAGEEDLAEHSIVIGFVPGTPAQTGEDVQVGDPVETLPGALYWTDVPQRGVISERQGSDPEPYFNILFDEPQHAEGEFPATYTRWSLGRLHFRLLEEDF